LLDSYVIWHTIRYNLEKVPMAARICREALEVSGRQNGPIVGDPRRAGHMGI